MLGIEELLAEAQRLNDAGNVAGAKESYTQCAEQGSFLAAWRLIEIANLDTDPWQKRLGMQQWSLHIIRMQPEDELDRQIHGHAVTTLERLMDDMKDIIETCEEMLAAREEQADVLQRAEAVEGDVDDALTQALERATAYQKQLEHQLETERGQQRSLEQQVSILTHERARREEEFTGQEELLRLRAVAVEAQNQSLEAQAKELTRRNEEVVKQISELQAQAWRASQVEVSSQQMQQLLAQQAEIESERMRLKATKDILEQEKRQLAADKKVFTAESRQVRAILDVEQEDLNGRQQRFEEEAAVAASELEEE